ncbi:MAG: tRNA (adenosine(37)-N6)-threonylcarbamoyltransferase complex ATPase subunit type 1 TsaE [Candidatus Caccosoma sp.]|nr:tRNA (adenosine(37)-N6)-threonylcarbamoyltransferase complex ATPase subunit type 1 TsaE [Candidatus Caccosoma sp.]
MEFKSKNNEQTYEFADLLAKFVKGGDVIFLNGDLGAGKTTFVKGFAKAKNVKQTVTSPTFTLLKTYKTDTYTIVHIDAYRLEGSSFYDILDYISNDNVIFIEWSSCLNNLDMFKERLEIQIKYISKNQRKFILTAFGKRYEQLLKELNEYE